MEETAEKKKINKIVIKISKNKYHIRLAIYQTHEYSDWLRLVILQSRIYTQVHLSTCLLYTSRCV